MMANRVADEINRLRTLLKDATPGPWEWVAADGSEVILGTVGTAEFEGHVLTSSACEACAKRGARCVMPLRANAALIVEAVNALPALLDALEQAAATTEQDASG